MWDSDKMIQHFIYTLFTHTYEYIYILFLNDFVRYIPDERKQSIKGGQRQACLSWLRKVWFTAQSKIKKDFWYILSPAFWVIHEVRSKGFLIMNFTDITVQRLRTSSFSAYHWWNIVGWFIFSILHCSMCTNLVFPQIQGTLSLIYGQSQGKCIHHLFLFRDLVLFVFHGLFVISTVGVFCAVDSSDI